MGSRAKVAAEEVEHIFQEILPEAVGHRTVRATPGRKV
jgi:hypothetical protein